MSYRLAIPTRKKAGLFGWSRGAEQALLLASLAKTSDMVAAVAANASTDTVVLAFNLDRGTTIMESDPRTGKQVPAAAWTWQNLPLYGERDPNTFGTGPAIEIEKYSGPLYLSHDTKDDLWSVDRSRRLEARRKTNGNLVTEAYYWEGEGHVEINDPTHQQQYGTTLRTFFVTNLEL